MSQFSTSNHRQLFDIIGLRQGEKRAFETIYLNFFDMLFHMANGYVRNKEVSKELVQDAFLKLWENRKELHKNTNIKNFLYTITKNSCLNYLKQQEMIYRNNHDYLIPEIKYKQDALASFPDHFSEVEELMEKVDEAIEKLPDEVKITFRLNRFDGLTYKQIAEKLDVSSKTVEARISKALKLLRSDLKDYLPAVQLIFLFLRL